jgi:Ni/Co efflux regulator RcnB
MRKALLITLVAATALSSPAVARHGHGQGRHYAAAVRHGHGHGGYHAAAVRHGNVVRADSRHHRRGYVVYSAPYRDWSYRRVAVGYRLRPAFYGSRYFISDYGLYGLRAPGRNLRWIRYGDDLLLVNIRTGRVLDVRPGRFY